jgi:hypothetical protein
MEYRGKGTIFFGKKIHDLRCWTDNCRELCQDLEGIEGDGKVIKLSGPDIHDVGFLFIEKDKLTVGEWCMPEETPAFPGFFLGSLLD